MPAKSPAHAEEFLLRCLATVNRRCLRNLASIADIRWGIPQEIFQNGHSLVPAASYLPADNVIVLHQVLKDYKCPRYVCHYLIYHECLHQLCPPEGDDIHPPSFRKREIFAPDRHKSLKWLRNHGFPVMDE